MGEQVAAGFIKKHMDYSSVEERLYYYSRHEFDSH